MVSLSLSLSFNPHPRICLLILEREEGRENIDVREKDRFAATCIYPDWRDQTCNLGMCPDWESNLQTFGVWDDAPTN